MGSPTHETQTVSIMLTRHLSGFAARTIGGTGIFDALKQ